jgi:hypothetical protein
MIDNKEFGKLHIKSLAKAIGEEGETACVTGFGETQRPSTEHRFSQQSGGRGIGVAATSGTASLTNTTVNLGSSGGVKGIVANGPGATLTLGAGSSVNASGGGGGNFGVHEETIRRLHPIRDHIQQPWSVDAGLRWQW